MLLPSMATRVPVQSAPKPYAVFPYLIMLCLKFDHICPTDISFVFVFVALRPKSTAMAIAGRSVHLTTLFPGQA